MKPILVEQEEMNNVVSVTVTSGTYSSHTVSATYDTLSTIDDKKICIKLVVTVIVTVGQNERTDIVTINGSCKYTTLGGVSPVLVGDSATSLTGTTVKVTTAGQSNTEAE